MQSAAELHPQKFEVRLAQTPNDIRAAQALRYKVFVEELGGDGPLVDHNLKLEIDSFDPHCDHLCLWDISKNKIVGVYRLMSADGAAKTGQFYSENEFDLSPLRASGRKLLELGRSCLHPEYRGGAAMFHLWAALSDYIDQHKIEILFGVASFHGTDTKKLAHSLSKLHCDHLAPLELRPHVWPKHNLQMDIIAPTEIDRKCAMIETPQLIKAYLRLGGVVGQGAYIDHAFNTIDVCLVLDVAKLTPRQRQIYSRNKG